MFEKVGQIFSTAIEALPKAASKALSKDTLRSLGEVMLATSAGLGNPAAQKQYAEIFQRKLEKREQEKQIQELAKGLELLAMTQNERLSPQDALNLARAFGPASVQLLLPQYLRGRTGIVQVPPPVFGGEPKPIGPQTQPTLGLPSGTLGNIATSLAMQEAMQKGEPFRPEHAWLKIPEALMLEAEAKAMQRQGEGRGQGQVSQRERFLEKAAAELVQAGRGWVDALGNPPPPDLLQTATVREMFERGYRLLGANDLKKVKAATSALNMITQVARAIAAAEMSGWLVPMTARGTTERAIQRAKLKALAAVTQDPVLQLLANAKSEIIGLGRNVYDEIGMRAIGAFEGLQKMVEPGETDYASAWVNLMNMDHLARKTLQNVLGTENVPLSRFPGAAWLPPPQAVATPEGKSQLAKNLGIINQMTIHEPTIAGQREALSQGEAAPTSPALPQVQPQIQIQPPTQQPQARPESQGLPQGPAAPGAPTPKISDEQKQRILNIIRELQMRQGATQ